MPTEAHKEWNHFRCEACGRKFNTIEELDAHRVECNAAKATGSGSTHTDHGTREEGEDRDWGEVPLNRWSSLLSGHQEGYTNGYAGAGQPYGVGLEPHFESDGRRQCNSSGHSYMHSGGCCGLVRRDCWLMPPHGWRRQFTTRGRSALRRLIKSHPDSASLRHQSSDIATG